MFQRRLLNTIGVTRGFGDHHLMTVDDRLALKPFLSPVPEVTVLSVSALDSLGDDDVLILASDGLWDVVSNERAAEIVRNAFSSTEGQDKYVIAAQDLVIAARGERTAVGRWLLPYSEQQHQQHVGNAASTDDITVFVVPLKYAVAPAPIDDDDDDDQLLS